jgi:hypothetical protein
MRGGRPTSYYSDQFIAGRQVLHVMKLPAAEPWWSIGTEQRARI